MRRDTILWTRTPASAQSAQAWLSDNAPHLHLHVAPLQTYEQRPLASLREQWPGDPASWQVAITSINGATAALAALEHLPQAEALA